jgi:hypothetical protein
MICLYSQNREAFRVKSNRIKECYNGYIATLSAENSHYYSRISILPSDPVLPSDAKHFTNTFEIHY